MLLLSLSLSLTAVGGGEDRVGNSTMYFSGGGWWTFKNRCATATVSYLAMWMNWLMQQLKICSFDINGPYISIARSVRDLGPHLGWWGNYWDGRRILYCTCYSYSCTTSLWNPRQWSQEWGPVLKFFIFFCQFEFFKTTKFAFLNRNSQDKVWKYWIGHGSGLPDLHGSAIPGSFSFYM